MDKQLFKYNLCKSLIELLGAEQATEDLYRLYEHHKKDNRIFSDKIFNDIEEMDKVYRRSHKCRQI